MYLNPSSFIILLIITLSAVAYDECPPPNEECDSDSVFDTCFKGKEECCGETFRKVGCMCLEDGLWYCHESDACLLARPCSDDTDCEEGKKCVQGECCDAQFTCDSDEMLVEITLKTDNKPNETSWHLKRRTAPDSIDSKPTGFYSESSKEYYYRYCVPDHQLYEFRIDDSGDDGIQGDHGYGYYRLEVNGTIEDEGGDFNRFAIDYFEGICDGRYTSIQFKLHTGTNPQFVSWYLSADSDTYSLPLSGGPWTNPFFAGTSLQYQLQECLPTANCYTVSVKSNPDTDDYEPSRGGSIELNHGDINIGNNNLSDGDEQFYTFGENCLQWR